MSDGQASADGDAGTSKFASSNAVSSPGRRQSLADDVDNDDDDDTDVCISPTTDAAMTSELFDNINPDNGMSILRHSCPEEEKLQMRKWVVTSILDSERTYLGTLDVLIALMKTFRNLLSTDEPVLCAADIDVIFCNVADLHEAHDTFVNDLAPRVQQWSDQQQVAELIKVLALMEYRVAGDFIQNYPKAVTTIGKCWRENPVFSSMTRDIEVPGRKEKQNLEQMLYTPIVRFQRNTLVLDDLINCTPTSHADYDILQKTRIIAQQFLDDQTADADSTPTEQRYLAKHGHVVEKVGDVRKLRLLLLFNDVLVCADRKRTIKQQTQLDAKWFIPLTDITLDDRVNANEEQDLADRSQLDVKRLQRTISELRHELRTEARRSMDTEQPLKRRASLTNRAKTDKTRKRLIEQQMAVIKASPRLIFRVHDRKHKTQHTLLMASDYERTTWRTAIADLLSRVNEPPTISNTDLQNLLNSKKLQLLPLKTLIGLDDLSLDDERLFGSLNVTVCGLQGITDSMQTSAVYCTVEVDSYNHFSTKAKTKSISMTSSWDENFEIELEGSQTVRILVYEESPTAETAETPVGMCGLELSKDWLTSEFQEKTVSINKEMSLTMRLSFCTRTNRTLARQLQPPLPNSSTAVFGASINDVQKQEGTNIPFVIATCIQEIDHRGLKEEGLYRIAGSTSAILKLKKAFEKHSKQAVVLTGEADIAVVTAIVKRYFRELPESLFTDSLYKELAKAVSLSDPETKQSLISQQIKSLPEPNRSTIVYIIDHLVRVASHESDNRMSLRNLAMVFGPTLLCSPSDDLTSDPQNLEQLVSKAPRDIAVQTTILHSVLELCRTNGSLF